MEIKKCKACGKEIGFIKTKAFRTVPVDIEPIWIVPGEGYSFILADGTTIKGEIAGDSNDDPDTNFVQAYISHFATCTEPDAFRKKRKGK